MFLLELPMDLTQKERVINVENIIIVSNIENNENGQNPLQEYRFQTSNF